MPKQYQIENNEKWSMVLKGLFAILLVGAFLAYPLMKGLGTDWGYGNSQNVTAQAELLRAKAEFYQSLSTFTTALPPALVEAGVSSLQFALALAIVLIALGAAVILIGLSYSLIVSARMRERREQDAIQYTSKISPDLSGVHHLADSYSKPGGKTGAGKSPRADRKAILNELSEHGTLKS